VLVVLISAAEFVMGIRDLEGEPLWIGAEVVRTNVTLTPDPGPAPIGMGVRFTTISEENRQFLANVLSEHIKPEYDT
jgi:hypothetical protein